MLMDCLCCAFIYHFRLIFVKKHHSLYARSEYHFWVMNSVQFAIIKEYKTYENYIYIYYEIPNALYFYKTVQHLKRCMILILNVYSMQEIRQNGFPLIWHTKTMETILKT